MSNQPKKKSNEKSASIDDKLANTKRISETLTRLKNAKKLQHVATEALESPESYPTGYQPFPYEAVKSYKSALSQAQKTFDRFQHPTNNDLATIDNSINSAKSKLNKKWIVPIVEIRGLINRITGVNCAGKFVLEIIDPVEELDVFEIDSTTDNTPVLRGNNAVALATAFNYYLKYYLYQEFPYVGDFEIMLPDTLPTVTKKIRNIFPHRYRHYYNQVDFRYTVFLYSKEECQRRFDWFAMNGYNTFMMCMGERHIWDHAKETFGFDDEAISELRKSSTGDSQYFATFDISSEAFEQEGELARYIADLAFRFGIKMQVPPFTGQVSFAFPNNHDDFYTGTENASKLTIDLPGSIFDQMLAYPGTRWMNLPQGLFISAHVAPEDEDKSELMRSKFYRISEIYWATLQSFFGYDKWGLTPDMAMRSMLAEQGFVLSGAAFSHETLSVIQDEMFKVNPDMIWVQDAWRYKSWISSSIDLDRSLMLEYKANNRPMWDILEYDNVPWVWCMTWNFGGNTGLDSGLSRLVYDISKARKKATFLMGLGATPEGGDTNPALNDLFAEMNWRDVDVKSKESADTWVSVWLKDYARRRYGAVYDLAKSEIDEMWIALQRVVYKDFGKGDDPAQTLVCAQPGVHGNNVRARFWGHYDGTKPLVAYDRTDMKEVLEKALTAADAAVKVGTLNAQFKYDIVDISRQALADLSEQIFNQGIAPSYANRDKNAVLKYLDTMIELCDDMDKLLGTTSEFMVGTRLQSSKSRGFTHKDIYFYDRLERTYLSYWILEEGVLLKGGKDAYDAAINNLFDYCNRHLAGLMTDYYGKRWQVVRDCVDKKWDGKTDLDDRAYYYEVKAMVKTWAEGDQSSLTYPEHIRNYATTPSGCPLEISKALYIKYYKNNPSCCKTEK